MRPGSVRTSLAVAAVLVLVTCAETPTAPDPPEATTVELSASALQVDDGHSASLEATVFDQYGDPMTGASVTWSSADPAIATVSGGTVSGVHPGQTTVTASVSSAVSASAAVTVLQVPTAMEWVAGEDQVGAAGEPLADSVRILLLDRHDEPVVGEVVAFTVTTGNGSVGAAQVMTGTGGTAATTWTLGTGAGEQKLQASCSHLSTPHETGAMAVAGPPARMVLVEGDGQSGTVAEPLADSIAVQVFDAFDNPAHGAVVAWEPDDADASFHPSVSTAGPDGIARARWTLGTVAGSQSAEAVVGGLTSMAVNASAGPGAPDGLVMIRGGDQTLPVGTVADTTEVKAVDRWGNAIQGVGVEWVVTLGGGTVTAVGSSTDADGLSAAEWELGPVKGDQVVRARADGVPEAVFRAVGVSLPDAITPVGGEGQQGVQGDALPRPLVVFVHDPYGNPVEGAPVTWQVSHGDGTVDPSFVRTGPDGLAETHWTLGTTGVDSVLATTPRWLAAPFGAVARQRVVHSELGGLEFDALGDTAAPAVSGHDIAGATLVDETLALLSWHSSDPGVVQRLPGGRFVSRGNGEAVIAAELDGVVAEAVVRVEQRAASIQVHNELFYGEVVLRVREREPLDFEVFDANGHPMDPAGTAFASDNAVVAGVEEDGVVMAKYPGYATVMLRRDTASAVVDIRVMPGEAIAAGPSHTCALAPSGEAYCWGRGDQGQLGVGYLPEEEAVPLPVVGGLKFRQIAGGLMSTCGVTLDSRLYCWGGNDYGQIGDGTDSLRVSPTHVMDGIRSVALGDVHSCALGEDGRAWCWGVGSRAGVGIDPNAFLRTPTQVFGNLRFRQITAAGWHACALDEHGVAYCWGSNTWGKLGDGSTDHRYVPTAVAGGHRFRHISAGDGHTCGATLEGEVYCWGNNSEGQLGDGTVEERHVPTRTNLAETAELVAVGTLHSCALTDSYMVYCWGANNWGQLGDDTSTDRLEPVAVYGADPYTWITAGYGHTCAIGAIARCWGLDGNGQLGRGGGTGTSLRPNPVQMPPGVIFAHLPPDWTPPTVLELFREAATGD